MCPNESAICDYREDKTKVESVQLGKPPTEPRVLKKVCVVVVGGRGGCVNLF